MNLFFIFTFYYKYRTYRIIFNLGIKTVLYLKYNCFKGFIGMCKTEKRNSQFEQGQPMEQRRGLFCTCTQCGSLSITTPVSLLANEFDDHSLMQGKVSLAAANQICVIREAINGCKNLKMH